MAGVLLPGLQQKLGGREHEHRNDEEESQGKMVLAMQADGDLRASTDTSEVREEGGEEEHRESQPSGMPLTASSTSLPQTLTCCTRGVNIRMDATQDLVMPRFKTLSQDSAPSTSCQVT
mmetsp:Transcript_6579/g.23280  ORF Transcript_6579/g.23280 Transcript_6579/m.23280 type:complete len:119 (-) Transcript_6579:247-603(-)